MSDTDEEAEEEITTIKVSRETWQRLTRRKKRPGDTYDEIVTELLNEVREDADEGG